MRRAEISAYLLFEAQPAAKTPSSDSEAKAVKNKKE